VIFVEQIFCYWPTVPMVRYSKGPTPKLRNSGPIPEYLLHKYHMFNLRGGPA